MCCNSSRLGRRRQPSCGPTSRPARWQMWKSLQKKGTPRPSGLWRKERAKHSESRGSVQEVVGPLSFGQSRSCGARNCSAHQSSRQSRGFRHTAGSLRRGKRPSAIWIYWSLLPTATHRRSTSMRSPSTSLHFRASIRHWRMGKTRSVHAAGWLAVDVRLLEKKILALRCFILPVEEHKRGPPRARQRHGTHPQ